jgi:peptidyl-prolyl cis-trans isomerase A (cyclophilin A)
MKSSIAFVLVLAAALAGCKSDQASSTPTSASTQEQQKPAAMQIPAPPAPAAAPAVNADKLYASFETSMGTIVVHLFPSDAPKTVENFVALAKGEKEWTDPKTGAKTTKPLYDGTIFHRVIPNFMIQGGDPLGTGTGDPGYRFADEFTSGRKFDKPCLLAMANAGPNTNGSQFFITEKPTPWLNNRHTIFGEVVKGCELVTAITNVPRGERDRPTTDVVLKHVAISETMPQ